MNDEVVPLCAELRIAVAEIMKKVCKKCKFYNERLGVCRGELLPVEEAVIRNAAGQGTCDDIKNFIKEGKDECETKSKEV
jgi:hypothetical protein